MKKVFNRVFAAAVAVPVALSQAFATTSAEEVTKVISVDRMLYIKPGETVSEWGADVESAMMGLAGINNTFDLNSVIASVSTDNQYYKLIKDLFALSEKPIVSVNNEATAATVSGTLNVQDFVNDVVIPDSMKNVDFGDYTITNPVADVQNITYSMTASFDGIVDTKTFLGNATFAEVNGTAIDDIFGYLNNVMDSVKTQLVDQIYAQVAEQEVEKKLAEKIAEAEAEGTVIDDEKLAELRTEAINSITPEDMADAKAEIESKVNAEISKYKNKINKLNEWYNKSLKWEKDKTYANMDEFLAALSAKVSNTTNGAFATPATVSGLSEYSSTLDSFVAQVNAISTPKGVKLEITMDDIMSVLSEATDVHVTSAESEYEMTFQIPDAEAEAEAEAYKPTAPDKAYDSSYKIVTLRGNINGKSAFFDVERVVIEKDVEETTTTSATTTTTNETTTTSSETTTSETTTSEVTTTSSETTT
ncbi:MAG: hypothetical protein IJZ64_09450, partial [Ruminococcus sp.]|nr:hypothetical protein [Ruminococcus sp.]